MSGTALTLTCGFGRKKAGYRVLGVLIGAAGLEAFAGYCLACKMFPLLIKLGVVPEDACEDCSNIWSRDAKLPKPISIPDLSVLATETGK